MRPFDSGRYCKSQDFVELTVSSVVIPTRSGDRSAIPWSEIQTEWRDREHRAARQAISAFEGLAIDEVDSLLFASEAPSEKSAGDILERAFAAAADAPDGELLLAMYLYGRCLEKWEQTEDYARIRIVLRALKNVASMPRPDGSSANGRTQLFSVVVGQAQVMTDAMGVVGQRFQDQEIYVPEMLISARARSARAISCSLARCASSSRW